MTDWRTWLDEKVLAVDLALDHLPAKLSEKMALIDKTVRELSEGYRLLAEAVEAERALREHQAQCFWAHIDKPGACLDGSCMRLEVARDKAYEAALDHLRDVGRGEQWA